MPAYANWNHQFVWPRDSYKGRSPRGVLHRIKDMLTNRGPDIFVQPKKSRMPIKLDEWSNWDSYHYWDSHLIENNPKLPRFCSRGTERYDPHKRKYVKWDSKENWRGARQAHPPVPTKEARKTNQRRNGRHPGTKDFSERERPEYDWFWREAHRAGENLNYGRHPYEMTTPWPGYRAHSFSTSPMADGRNYRHQF